MYLAVGSSIGVMWVLVYWAEWSARVGSWVVLSSGFIVMSKGSSISGGLRRLSR